MAILGWLFLLIAIGCTTFSWCFLAFFKLGKYDISGHLNPWSKKVLFALWGLAIVCAWWFGIIQKAPFTVILKSSTVAESAMRYSPMLQVHPLLDLSEGGLSRPFGNHLPT